MHSSVLGNSSEPNFLNTFSIEDAYRNTCCFFSYLSKVSCKTLSSRFEMPSSHLGVIYEKNLCHHGGRG